MSDENSIFGADPDRLRELVRSGLEADDMDGQEDAPATGSAGSLIERPGTRIGRYKLLRVLGEGGMGMVHLAEQEGAIRRKVALKVIKPGMDSKRVIARFEAERQALALLAHPNIAQIYDVGTTESGRPYFAMEYVKGLPITEYCDRHKLCIEERLRLFQQVCEAVQHAHHKGIIHRDIKPSNILVAVQEDRAIPKIIDFGVAKALSQPLTERTLFTEDSQLLGTPEYMSPEQTDMTSQDIDTRSDIYSLGALLYELLTGVLPFDPATLREGGIEHIRRVLRETDPKTPSTRLTRLGEEAKGLAESRRTEVAALARRLHKELEWIPLKAMRKERARRYRSASELADDIENYLQGAPLIAGPESAVYRVKKFVRCNRVLVTGAGAVLVVLLAGIVISTIFAIGQARARAEAQAVSDFLRKDVFGSLNLWRVKGQDVTARSVFDAASEKLEGRFADRPLVEASIRQELGGAYTFLGLYKAAESHFKRVFEIHRAELGTEHRDTVISMWHIGWVYWWQNRFDEAEPLLTEALQGMELVLDEDSEDRLFCMAVLAWLYNGQGRFNEGEQLFTKGLATVHRVLGEEHEYSPTFMLGLGYAYRMLGRWDEAERLLNEALELSRRVRGEQDIETQGLMQNLGDLYQDQGRYDEAEPLLLKARDGRHHVLGEQHFLTFEATNTLARLYHNQGRYKQAESLFARTMETARRVLGDAHSSSLFSMVGLGTVCLAQGRYDRAEPLLVNALEIWRRVFGQEHWITLLTMNTVAKLYTAQGRYAEAEELYRTALAAQRRVLGDEHPDTLESANDLGVLCREQQRYEEAESLLRQALQARQRKLGPEHPATLESMHELALLHIRQARYEDAEPLLLDAFRGRETKLGPDHPHTRESLDHLIQFYEAWGKPNEAHVLRAKTG